MNATLLNRRIIRLRRLLAVWVVLCLWGLPAQAQVQITVGEEYLVIENAGHPAQTLVQEHGGPAGRSRWTPADLAGPASKAKGNGSKGNGDGDDQGEDEPVVIIGGYQDGNGSGGNGDEEPPPDPVIIVGGYQQVLDHLRLQYDVVIRFDTQLGVHFLTLPGAEDPVGTILTALATDTLPDGTPLLQFIRLLEVESKGVFDDPAYSIVLPSGPPYALPNDPLYPVQQQYLQHMQLHRAARHQAPPVHEVRIAVIDSGIKKGDRDHEGLDGVTLKHKKIAELKAPVDHGLGVVSMLADANHDADGPLGLVGQWGEQGCYATPSIFDRRPATIISYNVGDFGPSTSDVAKAIKKGIKDRVDVINLSLKTAYSPLVEEVVREALAANIVVVAAAGNHTVQTGFPASIDGVIAVGATDWNMQASSISASQGVDIWAVGENVVLGGFGNVWHYGSGTSFAAPHVTAAVAMMRAYRPGLTPGQALEALVASAKNNAGMAFVDALGAVNYVLPLDQRIKANDVPAPEDCPVSSKQGVDADVLLPSETTLIGNYPNPFNPETTVAFYLDREQPVALHVYDVLGKQVAALVEEVRSEGLHHVRFLADDLPSGVYLYRLSIGGQSMTKRMLLLK